MIRIADIGVSLTSLTTLVTKVPLIIYAFLSLDADNLLSWQPITLCWYPAPQKLWNDYYRLFPFLCRWMIRQRFLICTCSCSQNFSRYGQLCGNPRTVIWRKWNWPLLIKSVNCTRISVRVYIHTCLVCGSFEASGLSKDNMFQWLNEWIIWYYE